MVANCMTTQHTNRIDISYNYSVGYVQWAQTDRQRRATGLIKTRRIRGVMNYLWYASDDDEDNEDEDGEVVVRDDIKWLFCALCSKQNKDGGGFIIAFVCVCVCLPLVSVDLFPLYTHTHTHTYYYYVQQRNWDLIAFSSSSSSTTTTPPPPTPRRYESQSFLFPFFGVWNLYFIFFPVVLVLFVWACAIQSSFSCSRGNLFLFLSFFLSFLLTLVATRKRRRRATDWIGPSLYESEKGCQSRSNHDNERTNLSSPILVLFLPRVWNATARWKEETTKEKLTDRPTDRGTGRLFSSPYWTEKFWFYHRFSSQSETASLSWTTNVRLAAAARLLLLLLLILGYIRHRHT